MEASDNVSVADRLKAAGISDSYASLIANGHRKPSQPLAIDIFRKTGLKIGPIADASDDDIDALERLVGRGKARAA